MSVDPGNCHGWKSRMVSEHGQRGNHQPGMWQTQSAIWRTSLCFAHQRFTQAIISYLFFRFLKERICGMLTDGTFSHPPRTVARGACGIALAYDGADSLATLLNWFVVSSYFQPCLAMMILLTGIFSGCGTPNQPVRVKNVQMELMVMVTIKPTFLDPQPLSSTSAGGSKEWQLDLQIPFSHGATHPKLMTLCWLMVNCCGW